MLPAQQVPTAGKVMAMIVSLLSTSVLTTFLTQRCLAIRSWSRLPVVVWLVFAIYTDSYLFVFASALLQHTLGVNSSQAICDSAILLCILCYVTSKFIYLFLVEKAHIIRGSPKKRTKSRLYMFNSVGMLGIYAAVIILNFFFRIARFEGGECMIGMRGLAMVPLISFDTVANVYLTIIFLIPLRRLYSFKNMPRTAANARLRTISFRTFCGAICTLLSSMINLSVLMSLGGEPGWICLMSCNCDILFSTAIIQWVTSKDNAGTSSAATSSTGFNNRGAQGQSSTTPLTPCAGHSSTSSIPSNSLHPNTAQSSNKSDVSVVGHRASGGGVVVTTTIQSEVEPERSSESQGRPVGNSKDQDCYAVKEGRMSFGDTYEDGYGHTRTSITADQNPFRI